AGIVHVDAVQRVVPGAVARAVDVDAAAGVRSADYTRLSDHEIQRVAPALSYDRQGSDRLSGDQIAVGSPRAGLDGFEPGEDFHRVHEGAYYEAHVDRGRLSNADDVITGCVLTEAAGLHFQLIVARLDGFERIRSGIRCLGAERDGGAL